MLKSTSKKNIAFLPGWGFSAAIWQPIAAHLDQHHVQQLDLPMLSINTDIQHAIHQLAADLPDEVILIGWSLGGLIATALSVLYPAKVSRLILVASLPKFVGDGSWQGIHPSVAKRFTKNAMRDFTKLKDDYLTLVTSPSCNSHALNSHLKFDSIDQPSLLRYLNFMFKSDFRKTLQTPTHYIFGSEDAIFDIKDVDYLRHMQNTHVIQGAGHALFLSHQAAFIEALCGLINV